MFLLTPSNYHYIPKDLFTMVTFYLVYHDHLSTKKCKTRTLPEDTEQASETVLDISGMLE